MKLDYIDRKHIIETLDYLNPAFAVVFNFNRILSRKKAEQALFEFERRLLKKLLIEQDDDIQWVHCFELEKGNTHFHSVPIMPSKYNEKFENHAKHIWAALINTPNQKGQLWIGEYQQTKWARYMTKDGMLVETIA